MKTPKYLSEPILITDHRWEKDVIPIVSVCITTDKHELFIGDCIESVLIQKTKFPVSICIFKDCSTDRNAEIIKEYKKKYPDLFYVFYKPGKSWGNPIRKVVISSEKAKGEAKYIALCECSAYWTDPYKLQKQVDFLDKNPEYVVAYHNAKVVDQSGKILKESELDEIWKKDYSRHELKIYRPIVKSTMCFRNVIELNNFLYKCFSRDSYLTSVLGNYGLGKYLINIKDAIHRKHLGSGRRSKTDQQKIFLKLELNLSLCYLYSDLGDDFYSDFFMERACNHLKKIINNNYLFNNTALTSFFVKVLGKLRDKKNSDLPLSKIIDYRNLMDLKKFIDNKEYTKFMTFLKIFVNGILNWYSFG